MSTTKTTTAYTTNGEILYLRNESEWIESRTQTSDGRGIDAYYPGKKYFLVREYSYWAGEFPEKYPTAYRYVEDREVILDICSFLGIDVPHQISPEGEA